jgi:hypothetical protein
MGRDSLWIAVSSSTRRIRVALAGVAFVATIACAIGCNSSSAAPGDGGPQDATSGDDVQTDSGGGGNDSAVNDSAANDSGSADSTVAESAAPEGGGGDASDAAAPDASDAETADAQDGGDGQAGDGGATLWLPGNITIEGITSDNYVIYQDLSTTTWYARPLAGGASTLLYTVPATATNSYGNVVGKTVFIYGWRGSNYTGTLTSWSSGAAQPGTLTDNALAYLYQTAWASKDSPYVAYLQLDTFGVSNLYGANVDGTGVTLLAANVDTYPSDTSCFPRVAFRGGFAVAAYCSDTDAGGVVPVIQSFAIGNGWAPSVIVTSWVDQYRFNIENVDPSVFPFGIDPDGGRVIAASSTDAGGSLQVFPIDGGLGTVLDPSWQLNPSLSFAGTKTNPWSVVYNTDAGVLKQTSVANPAPQVLLDGGVNYFDAFSASGKWMITSTLLHPVRSFQDLSVTSTVNPGQSLLLATSAQYGNTPLATSGYENRAFTSDERYAIIYTDMYQTTNGAWAQKVRAAAVTPPLALKLLSTGDATDATPMAGSKVAIMDNYVPGDGGAAPVTFDLHVADPSSSAPPTLVASGLPGRYNVTHDGSAVLYTVTGVGIYEYVLP